MAEISWIKISTNIFDDEKLLLIESMPEADALIVIWFKLLALAGKSNNNGVFMISEKIPYTEDMLATIFRRKKSVITLALDTFEQLGMIERIDNVITIPNWEKHQNTAKLNKIREQTRLRVAENRKRNRLAIEKTPCNADVTQPVTEEKESCNGDIPKCNEDVTDCNAPCNADVTQQNREEKNREEKNTHIQENPEKQTETQNLDENQKKSCVRDDVCASESYSQNFSEHEANLLSNPQKYYAKLVFDVWEEAGLPRPKSGYVTFLMRDFRLALSELQRQKLHSDDVIQACKNYAKIIALNRQGQSWWDSKSTFDNFVKPNVIKRFLPDYFDLESFKKIDRGKGSAISKSGEYNNVEIDF